MGVFEPRLGKILEHTHNSIASGDAAGGDLSGTYPNPSVADDSHNHTETTINLNPYIDILGRELTDSNGNTSAAWEDRNFNDASGGEIFAWGSGNLRLNRTFNNTGVFLDTSNLSGDDKTIAFPNDDGTFALQTAASGTFTTADAKTVTVVNGIITSIV